MQLRGILSNPSHKMKKLYLKKFLIFSEKKYTLKISYLLGKKPDLTYYHNSFFALKNFLHFTEKNPSKFPTPSLQKYIYIYFSKKTSYTPRMTADEA